MAGEQRGRLRKVALTGILVPGLLLGAAGVGFLPGGATAQSVISNGPCTAFGAPSVSASEMSIADVAEQANPAVVTIVSLLPLSEAGDLGFSEIEGFPDMPGFPDADEIPGIEGDESQGIDEAQDGDTLVPAGTGSGFIVDETGHVVTNAHVVAGAAKLSVALFDGTEVPAEVVGTEPILDVAIIKLDLPAGVAVPGIAKFGDSAALRAGDPVVAIGNALGSFPNTVSEGTVNATDRAFPSEGGLTTMIQHDAEIWHGNSGGPLLNLRGEVIGINTAGIGSGIMGADSGAADMAFAVEGNTVCSAAARLLERGEIVWPYLGIEGQATPDGQEVIEVVEDGPSAAAGIEPGDVITSFADQSIDRQHSLLDLLFGMEAGDVVNVTIERDGDLQTFQVTLGERPDITE